MAACPFGAIADKSQIYQLIQAIKKGDKVVAAVAPAIIGQFGPKVTPGKTKTALLKLGFKDIYEVAYGADMGCITEAHHYVSSVATGKLPFLFTSCCPAWVELTRRQFPDLAPEISQELTPMVATARHIKEKDPEARVVFIGPCAAKKLEASRTYIRSYVDFVITFEELVGMFDALDINPEELEESPIVFTATGCGTRLCRIGRRCKRHRKVHKRVLSRHRGKDTARRRACRVQKDAHPCKGWQT